MLLFKYLMIQLGRGGGLASSEVKTFDKFLRGPDSPCPSSGILRSV